MLENEIKVINDLINVKRRHSFSENGLRGLCGDFNASFKVVLIILIEKYNARYVPPYDPRNWGTYHFDNPNYDN